MSQKNTCLKIRAFFFNELRKKMNGLCKLKHIKNLFQDLLIFLQIIN